MFSLYSAFSFVSVGALSLGSSLAFAESSKKPVPASEIKSTPKEVKKMTPKTVKATIKTTLGTIVVELDQEKAPITVENFVSYAKSGFYDKTIFHRVINGFMIQGGGFSEKMDQKSTKAAIKNEGTNGLKNDKGTLAMARTNDPNSATAQFFINLTNNDFLNNGTGNPGYAVFGHVTEGMSVVEEIAKVKTGNVSGMADVPTKAIVLESVTVGN